MKGTPHLEEYINLNAWGVVQWFYLFIQVVTLSYYASQHGKPMLERKTNEPMKYNGIIRFIGFVFIILLLVTGGFFAPVQH